jgi:branched-subunit amino acid transport protein
MTLGTTDGWTLLTIAGLACVTVIARSFFFISQSDWKLPHWAERGLQYAPIAALAHDDLGDDDGGQGALISSLQDARLYGAAAGAAVFYWRKSTLGCIIGGMAVYLPLHLALGW